MNLIIDVGNSQVKVAVFKQDELVSVETMQVDALLNHVKKKFKKDDTIDQIMVSSVGNLPVSAIESLKKYAPVMMLTRSLKLPFKNDYGSPDTLGVDRIALIASASTKYPKQNCLVIDAGSCITYDFINQEGHYKGGAIAPGLKMRFKAMHAFTEGLPLVDSFELKDFIGTNTQECMISGAINGSVQEIDAVISQYQKKFKDLTVILTGGDSHFLSKRLKSSIFAHPNFLLKGVNCILELNKH
ncbi:pantothenate kinase [Galbibacter marinus]|uniref:Type III pantothenate kinase n=1 Tax=Galbibacter marinus TaxID=555500 RepID=K2PN34_9FLAO|nr:type III pantothenate kinase [Galbibacter marinus]EKF53940.1 pantothenate kinase [Galbibacter marinus]